MADTSKSNLSDEEHQRFLIVAAEEIDRALCGMVELHGKFVATDTDCVHKRFRTRCNTVIEKYKIYDEAKEALDKKVQQWERLARRREKKDQEREAMYCDKRARMERKQQLPPDPRMPGNWDICGAEPCCYAVMAVIHNRALSGKVKALGGDGWFKPRTLRDITTTSGDFPFVFISTVWGFIAGSLCGYDKQTIERALRYVKADLAEHCRLQEPVPAETRSGGAVNGPTGRTTVAKNDAGASGDGAEGEQTDKTKKKNPPVTQIVTGLLVDHPEWESQPTMLLVEVNKKAKAQGFLETKLTTLKSTLTRMRNKQKKKKN